MDNFDKIIKNKLKGIHPMPSDDAWSKFTQKKNNIHEADEQILKITDADKKFDSYLQGSLSHLTPTYNPAHWSLLYEKLQIIQARQNTIIVSKSIEALSVFLIIMTLFHIQVFEGEQPKSPSQITRQSIQPITINTFPSLDLKVNSKHQSTKYPGDSKAKLNSLLPSANVKLINPKPRPEAKTSAKIQIIKSAPIVAIDKFTRASNQLLTSTSLRIAQGGTNQLDISKGNPNANIGISNDSQTLEVLPTEKAAIAFDESQNSSESTIYRRKENNSKNSVSSQLEKGETIEKLDALQMVQPEVYSELAIAFPEINYVTSKKNKIYLSAFGSSDINLINTPFDKLYSKAAYSKEARSNSYGIIVGKEYGDVSIETGLLYSNRAYQPQVITDIYGRSEEYYYEKTFNNISYDMVSVPLNLKYNFVKNKQWSAYLVSNLALNLVVNAQYNINKEIKSGSIAARYDSETSRLSEKGFISGIFHKEQVIENSYASNRFEDNYFITMGLGFGICNHITKNLSIFIQPIYNRHVLSSGIGIGPNKDKIHSASLMMGITYDLP